jgi:hypothetical protein
MKNYVAIKTKNVFLKIHRPEEPHAFGTSAHASVSLFSEHYYSISAHNEKREAIFPVSFLYNDF